jgi:hypothetical protein
MALRGHALQLRNVDFAAAQRPDLLLRRSEQAMRASVGAFLESEARQVRIPRSDAIL